MYKTLLYLFIYYMNNQNVSSSSPVVQPVVQAVIQPAAKYKRTLMDRSGGSLEPLSCYIPLNSTEP